MPDKRNQRIASTQRRESSSPADANGRRYRHAFVARYLKPLVFETMIERGWKQYQVAEWLGMPEHALSEYLTGRSHPSEARIRELAPLGFELERLRRAMLADKLTYWVDTMNVGMDDVLGAVRRIEAQHARREGDRESALTRLPRVR